MSVVAANSAIINVEVGSVWCLGTVRWRLVLRLLGMAWYRLVLVSQVRSLGLQIGYDIALTAGALNLGLGAWT